MAVASDYRISTPYGQVAGYPLNNGFHKGEDRPCPIGTPVVVNGVKIGTTGNTGASTGPHLHIGRFTQNGSLLPPEGRGFSFNRAQVIAVAFDSVNGKWIRVLGDGYYYIYCHLNTQDVAVGQVLTPPKIDEDTIVISNTDNEFGRWNKLFVQIRGRASSREEFVTHGVGKTWLKAVELLSDSSEADGAITAQNVGQVAIRDNWQGQIERLINEKGDVQSQLTKLQNELDSLHINYTDLQLKFVELSKETAAVPITVVEEEKPSLSTPPEKTPVQKYSWLTKLVATMMKKR